MASYPELKRRSLLPLVGVGLGLYYLLVYVPLADRAASLDEPLQKAWNRLSASLEQTNVLQIDFQQITNQLEETRRALSVVQATKQQAAERLAVPAALRAKLNASFQLVDYENERSKQMEQLGQEAAKQKVTLDPAVLIGFPEYTVDVREPALLWAALSMTDELLDAAVRCQVAAVHSLEVSLAVTNAPAAERAGTWAEVPIQIEFTAPAAHAIRFIQSMPRRAEEMPAAGLPEGTAGKLPLYIDRMVIKKQSPEKLDEVRVWLRAVGFVLREKEP